LDAHGITDGDSADIPLIMDEVRGLGVFRLHEDKLPHEKKRKKPLKKKDAFDPFLSDPFEINDDYYFKDYPSLSDMYDSTILNPDSKLASKRSHSASDTTVPAEKKGRLEHEKPNDLLSRIANVISEWQFESDQLSSSPYSTVFDICAGGAASVSEVEHSSEVPLELSICDDFAVSFM
jgi:hypothetical protein